MGTTAPSRTQRRKAKTVQAILDSAEREFITHGYHAARVEDIAALADVSVGSIYVHFGGKFALYTAILDRALTVEETYLASAFAADLTPGDQLAALGEAYRRFFADEPGYFRLLTLTPGSRNGRDEPTGVQLLAERGERLIAAMARIIAAGVAEGSLRSVDADHAARFLWGAWSGVLMLNLRPDRLALSDDELRAVLDQGRSIVAGGLAPADQ